MNRILRRLLVRDAKHHPKYRRPRRRLSSSIQPLEDRRLMAADVSFATVEPVEVRDVAAESDSSSTAARARDVLVLIGPNGELIYTSG